ncbi:hypothetical protein [Virgibacillus pantothenticus]
MLSVKGLLEYDAAFIRNKAEFFHSTFNAEAYVAHVVSMSETTKYIM